MKNWGKDKSSYSNLPQDVTHTSFPKQEGLAGELDDTITGIDETVDHGKGKARKYMSNQK